MSVRDRFQLRRNGGEREIRRKTGPRLGVERIRE
jgi:hypothetical protein